MRWLACTCPDAAGCTLFIRGIPFDMEEHELSSRFSKYGSVVYAKIVTDKATGVYRGTGFVKVRVRAP